jgi:hypothetical protein
MINQLITYQPTFHSLKVIEYTLIMHLLFMQSFPMILWPVYYPISTDMPEIVCIELSAAGWFI